MIYLTGALALITLVAVLALVQAMQELMRQNRELANRVMARDLTEYARCKPALEQQPESKPKPERARQPQRVEPTFTVTDADVISAQTALESLRGE